MRDRPSWRSRPRPTSPRSRRSRASTIPSWRQLPGKSGSYSAITDARGYFEMRIPREDFAGDLCNLDWWHSFSDESMTLQYIVDFE
jgi:hypothetical protein